MCNTSRKNLLKTNSRHNLEAQYFLEVYNVASVVKTIFLERFFKRKYCQKTRVIKNSRFYLFFYFNFMSKYLEFNAQDMLNITFSISIYTKLNKTCADSSYFCLN